MTADNDTEKEIPVEPGRSKIDFFHQEIILGKGENLTDPETAQETFDMELWFGPKEYWDADFDQIKTNLREKLGVDVGKTPDSIFVDPEGNTHLSG